MASDTAIIRRENPMTSRRVKKVRSSMWLLCVLSGALACACSAAAMADEASTAYDRTEDVIYGRKFGTALTLDVFRPKQNANGAAVIWTVSGGWFSSHEA